MIRGATILVTLAVAVAFAALPVEPGADAKGDRAVLEQSVAAARKLLQQERTEEALAVLAPLAEQAETAKVYRLVGEIHRKLDHPAEARRCYAKVVSLEPGSARDRFELASLYQEEGKHALAVEQLLEAQSLGMDDVALHQELAVAYSRLGNYLGHVRTVSARGRRAGRIWKDVYLIEPAGDREDTFLAAPSASAIYHSQRALDAGLDTFEVRLTHARIWLRARRYSRAAKIYAALESRTAWSRLGVVDRARILYEHAEALYGADDMEGYLERLQGAVTLDGVTFGDALAEGYAKVAARYNQRADLARYIHYLELALAEAPRSAKLHYRLGNGYWEAGRKRRAARQWQIMLQLDPDHPNRRRILELIESITAPSP